MPDKPTPQEIEDLFVEETGFATDDFPAAIFDFARAVLAKWGTPAGAEEPFCWHWENTFNGGTGAWKKNPETLGINMSHPDYKWTALYTAPQPSPAPLSAREIELLDGMIDAQLDHAKRCDLIPNRPMAEKQKGWDMERVTLLRKLKASMGGQQP